MIRRKILILFLLGTGVLSPLWAFDYGVRFNFGVSSGTGSEWYETLAQSGSISFNRVLPTVGIGAFGEFIMAPSMLFVPELNIALNRGVEVADNEENSIRTQTPFSLELMLPVAHDFSMDSGNRALRVLGGFQLLYSFNLSQRVKIDDNERENSDMELLSPLSLGLVMGGGLEFRKQKKTSWFVDAKLIIPITNRIRYELPDGSDNKFKTIEFLLGSGIKF